MKRYAFRSVLGLALIIGALCATGRAQDTTTMLSLFLVDLRAGTFGATQTFTSIGFRSGTAGTINGPTGANFNVLAATANSLRLGNADGVPLTLGGTAVQLGTTVLMSLTAPTISSGFGTSPAILSSNGTTSFRVNVGTGGAATSGVIGMPASNTGWNCQVTDLTNNTVTRETASTTTTVTVTAAAAWAASDTLIFNCSGF